MSEEIAPSTSWHTYPKINSLGHHSVRRILDGDIDVEEKVDGSQFSFGVFDGVLRCKSKGKDQSPGQTDKMFSKAIEVLEAIKDVLHPEWTYRGEYLQSPKHNTHAHERIPRQHIILFNINDGHESYLSRDHLVAEAARLGFEVVPLFYSGPGCDFTPSALASLMQMDSVLGGCKIEGVVIKQYKLFGEDGKCLFAKHVSEAFKEAHTKVWGEANPKGADIIDTLVERYRTDARYEKAVQHLRDAGALLETPADIGPLIKEVRGDILLECADEIKHVLFAWAWERLSRQLTSRLPQWYKDKLAAEQFTPVTEAV